MARTKTLILILALAGLMMQPQAQTLMAKDVPTTVTEAFAKNHPAVQNAKWTKNGSEYEVEYLNKKENARTRQRYNASGVLVETRVDIPFASLPASVIDYVQKSCSDDGCVYDTATATVSRITNSGGTNLFEVRVKDRTLFFDSNGKVIKSK